MDYNLKGKIAIVTGAARGIGRGIALTLSREGANVVIDDIDLDAAKLVEEAARKLGTQSIAIKADVTKPDEVRQMVKETLERFGRIDILVNNAGIWYIDGEPVGHKLFKDSAEYDWSGELGVTLYGVLNCSKAVLETMLSQKSGSIINIASDAARAPRGSRTTVYGAGKGGIISFSRNLAYELGPSGIRVNCVSPGLIKTSRGEAIESGMVNNPEILKFWQEATASVERMPLHRIGVPQDIANVVAFFASDISSYVTGQTLSVNAGLYMA